jgi:hypothetical protein
MLRVQHLAQIVASAWLGGVVRHTSDLSQTMFQRRNYVVPPPILHPHADLLNSFSFRPDASRHFSFVSSCVTDTAFFVRHLSR